MTKTSDAIAHLHTRLIDSADGYRQALETSDSHAHAALFREMIERRERNAAELRAYLNDRGMDLDDDGSILAAAHRVFLQLKSMLGGDEKAVLDEVVRGEKALLDAYNDAIEPATLETPEFDFLNRQYRSLSEKVGELEAMQARAA